MFNLIKKPNKANIISICTDVPNNRFSQKELKNILLSRNTNENKKKFIDQIYDNSKISYRNLKCTEYFDSVKPIGERLKQFKCYIPEILLPLCIKAIQQSNINKTDIDMIIVVSSTGIFAPSIDVELIKLLDLRKDVHRNLVFFMGCAAAIVGLKIANDFICSKKTHTNVLMITAELSSIHTNFNENKENCYKNIITHSIFSDGMSACIISSRPSNLRILDSFSYLLDNSEDGIVLSIEEDTIQCVLSKYLPMYISKSICKPILTFIGKHKLQLNDIVFWAIHPGGKRIIESVQQGLSLSERDVKESWNILDQYGNMLSSSIMFVLERLYNDNNKNTETKTNNYCIAISFSPGVGMECLLLRKKTKIIK